MLHRIISLLARVMAMLGGLVLCAIVVMVCLSIIGREVNGMAHGGYLGGFGDWLIARGVGPITGDFELIEAGIAFAIFAFLPLTQLTGAHATVDIFTSGLGPKANNLIAAFWSVVMAVVILLITWRLFAGMQDKLRYGETTFLIQFPVWWAYAASFVAALVASLVSLYCAAMRLTGARTI
ncbi:TRAP transporter small permease [Cognatiyoonia sp. IB215446]|nr:TRAP transporter small permease [Cognatiyoonia sp. IB215446]MDX8349483.1 TRAP transporter small permease [Cognatiyoonia sp. IB215446]